MKHKIELKNLNPSIIEFLAETGYKYSNQDNNPIYFCNAAIIKKENDKLYLISEDLFRKELGEDRLMDLRFGKQYLFNFGFYSKQDMEKAFIAGGKMAKNIENPDFYEFIEQLNKEK